jgi:hypothetical protein
VRLRRAACERAEVRRRGEKPGFPHPIVTIGFGVGVLLALDFNRGRFLCVFFRCIMVGGSQRRIFYWVDHI